MNCWSVLEVAPGADRSQIKRAYAKKLKQTRPDVDPQGFKQLHAAYKTALSFASVGREHDVSPGSLVEEPQGEVEVIPLPELRRSAPAEPFSPPAEEKGHSSEKEILVPEPVRNVDQIWAELDSQLTSAMRDPETARDLVSWAFLEESEGLQEIQLRSDFSRHVFERILNQNQALQPVVLRRDDAAFAYLCEFFGWAGAYDHLADWYGYEEVENWLEPFLERRSAETQSTWRCPDSHPGPLVIGGYYRRIGATLFDLLILIPCIHLVGTIRAAAGGLEDAELGAAIVLSAPVYLLWALVFEASPIQGTPGKVFLNLKVTTRKGKRMGLLFALLRTMVYGICMALIKIVIWFNFFTNDGRLLHDRLSGTVVINRN